MSADVERSSDEANALDAPWNRSPKVSSGFITFMVVLTAKKERAFFNLHKNYGVSSDTTDVSVLNYVFTHLM